MKKNILNLSTLILAVGALTLTSCGKKTTDPSDTTAPVVTLNGAPSVTISLQGIFTDLGATATDDKDGAVAVTKGGAVVDVNKTGVYVVSYSATDVAGNTGKADRSVTVVNDLASMAGVYTCTINTVPTSTVVYTYTQTITPSTSINNRLVFGYFAYYKNNDKIYANVTGTTTTAPIDLPSQVGLQVGTPAADRTFIGSGTRTSATNFALNYSETTSGITKSYIENFVKK